jgi:hypothetical protein
MSEPADTYDLALLIFSYRNISMDSYFFSGSGPHEMPVLGLVKEVLSKLFNVIPKQTQSFLGQGARL